MTTITDTRRQEMMSRVQKLLNMTEEKGCSISEAQVALGKVQSILVDYNISMKDVVIEDRDEILEVMTSAGANTNRSYFSSLAFVIARNFRCKVFARSMNTNRTTRAVFYGRKSDAESAEVAFRYAYNVAWYGVRKERDRFNEENTTNYTVREFSADYYTGFVFGLKEYFEELVESKSSSYELMLVIEDEVEEAYNDMSLEGHYTTTTHKDSPDPRTYQRGYDEGKEAMNGMNRRVN